MHVTVCYSPAALAVSAYISEELYVDTSGLGHE